MKKVAIVYWSGTGNTAAMAEAVKDGAVSAGADVVLLSCDQFDASMISDFSSFAFGCPAMGAEVLEEIEFEPMFNSIKNQLGGKSVALFGSYGWGSGDWMRSWEQDCDSCGIRLVCDSVICCEAPDDAAIESCKALGAALC